MTEIELRSDDLVRPLRWWTFRQNNAYGVFVRDAERGIGPWMIVEAADEESAYARLGEIGCDLDDECRGCCGMRWYPIAVDAGEIPEIYGVRLDESDEARRQPEDIHLHGIDGRHASVAD